MQEKSASVGALSDAFGARATPPSDQSGLRPWSQRERRGRFPRLFSQRRRRRALRPAASASGAAAGLDAARSAVSATVAAISTARADGSRQRSVGSTTRADRSRQRFPGLGSARRRAQQRSRRLRPLAGVSRALLTVSARCAAVSAAFGAPFGVSSAPRAAARRRRRSSTSRAAPPSTRSAADRRRATRPIDAGVARRRAVDVS